MRIRGDSVFSIQEMAAIKIIIVLNIITIAQNHVLTFADVVPEILGIFYSI